MRLMRQLEARPRIPWGWTSFPIAIPTPWTLDVYCPRPWCGAPIVRFSSGEPSGLVTTTLYVVADGARFDIEGDDDGWVKYRPKCPACPYERLIGHWRWREAVAQAVTTGRTSIPAV